MDGGPEEFQYLVRKDGRNGEETVEGRYARADLARKPVVRDELNRKYLVFGSRDELFSWYRKVPAAERCWHEVVFGFMPQRLKFDVDMPAHKLDAIPDRCFERGDSAVAEPWPEAAEPQAARVSTDDYLASILGGEAEAEAEPQPVPQPADLIDALLQGFPEEPLLAVAEEEEPAAAAGATTEERPGRDAKAGFVVDELIEAVLDELHVAYYGIDDICPTRKDLAVTDSSGPTPDGGWKYSYHVLVLPYAVPDNEEASELTARVLERLPPAIRPFVDPGVNRRIQNFRLPESSKPGTGRVKRATPEAAARFGTAAGVPTEGLLVAASSGMRILQRAYTEDGARPDRAAAALSAHSPEVLEALDLAAQRGITAGHELREVRGTLLCFDRTAPSHCAICGETHHRDNTLMLSLDAEEAEDAAPGLATRPAAAPDPPGGGPARLVCREHCRHARGRAREVGTVTAATAAGGAGRRRDKRGQDAASAAASLAAQVAAIRSGRANPHEASEFEALPEDCKTVYSEPAMRDYELVPTLAVLAQMKLGKTKAMRRYLDAHFPADALVPPVVRWITFRQTFTRSVAEGFPDFAVYSDVQGDIDHVRHPRCIVQAESLHRLRMAARPEPVDLLIIDEVESVLAQFNSGLHRHFGAAFAMLQWMLRTARHVVCMDANLGDRTFRTLARMRPARPAHFHWNRHARAADDTYLFTADQGAWLERLHAAVRRGDRVVLPTNSLAEAKAFDEALRQAFPAKKITLYSSETPPSEKALHFGDVHRWWGDLDVLIYTPTCSAGVSFEKEHFDCLFGYFCDTSCDVETCRQMLGRVRSLRTREHCVCLRAGPSAGLPTAVADIRRLLHDKRASLYRAVESSFGPAGSPEFEYGPEGEIRYYESDYFHLWLESVRVANLSRNDFARRFVCQVADTGASVAVLQQAGGAAGGLGAALLTSHKETRHDLRAARAAAVAAAPELSPEEAGAVREALQSQQDVEPQKRLALERFQLCDYYSWHQRPLDAAFVAAYQTADARRVYRNLTRITECESTLDSLRLMQQREAGQYSWVMDTRTEAYGFVNESRDLLRDRHTYVYQAHFLAMWILRLCGFCDVLDRRVVHEASLEARLRAALPLLKRAGERLIREFEIRKPRFDNIARIADSRQFLAAVLRPVNEVLRAAYGLQVGRVPKRGASSVSDSGGAGAYNLKCSPVGKLFVVSQDPDPDDAEGGPRPHIPSRLRENKESDGRLELFVDDAFFARADEDEEGPPTPAPAPQPREPEPRLATPRVEVGHAQRSAAAADADLDAFLREEFERIVMRE